MRSKAERSRLDGRAYEKSPGGLKHPKGRRKSDVDPGTGQPPPILVPPDSENCSRERKVWTMSSTTHAGRTCLQAIAATMFLSVTMMSGCENAGQGALSGGAVGALGGLAIGSLSGNAGQ